MPLAAASGVGRSAAARGWMHTRAKATRQLHALPLRRGSYFWKQHPSGLQGMLLVLAPALTVLESLVKLHLAASELFKHRQGGYWLQEVSFFFSERSSVEKAQTWPARCRSCGEAKQLVHTSARSHG